jgi:hypothetical protein
VAEKLNPFSVEGLSEFLTQWEAQHLLKQAPAQSNREFGIISEHLRKIGINVGRRLAAAMQNRCGQCKGPLPTTGPFDTIPEWSNATGAYINLYACKRQCAEKLRERVHAEESKRASA